MFFFSLSLSSFLYLSSKIFFCLTGFFNKYENVIHVNRRTYVDRKDDSRQFKGSVFVLFKVNAYKLCTSTFIDNYPMQLHTLYNDRLRIARKLVETSENIKIESHPFHHIICD